jgi:polar amino acid transport system substrate-binding protein
MVLAVSTKSRAALAVNYGFPDRAPTPLMAKAGQEPAPGPAATVAQGSELRPAAASADAPAPAPPTAVAEADVEHGHRLFNRQCSHCHGPDAIQGVHARNLRNLQHKYGQRMDEVFKTTATNGRVKKGIPKWGGILSESEMNDILAFLHTVQEAP